MQNAFGLSVPEIKEILQNSTVEKTIHRMLLDVLVSLDLPLSNAEEITQKCLNAASSYSQLENYEEKAHKILETMQVTGRVPQKLSNRAELMYRELKKHLLAGTVLDYGCGDGKVGEYIAKTGCQVALADVYRHSHVAETGLEFRLFGQGQTCTFGEGVFDNVLALTVFHHSSNPVGSIQDVARVTRRNGRVIVIESVYGVKGEELPQEFKQKIASYLALSAEQQRRVNIFFDHFYNRVLHYSKNPTAKVNVPLQLQHS